ncbi:TRAF3-interacting JNK-activating modulator [Rhinoderma darwinii]|uniref:TRAF3-interacting JNK-activating modulator n=1 Tax=Rhinoderma darwinii TaxID=43563 RepID=UPI003F6633F7
MVTKNGTSPVRQKIDTENFEEKYDRRLEFHETLRSRHNATSCRQDNPSWSKQQERHSPRVQERHSPRVQERHSPREQERHSPREQERHSPREQERHSPREQEFFRRRHIWTDESDKQIRSPPKSNKYIRHSSTKQNAIQMENKDEEVSTSCQFSWHHNSSKTNLLDFRTKISEPCLEAVHSRTKNNDVTKRERGVQTIQEKTAICLKKDSSQQTDSAIAVLNGELLQLSEYLVEALHRERKLKKKLCVLQELLSVLVQTSEKSWMAQLNEDHLNGKVANLENQLFYYTQSFPKTSVKKLLLEMEEHKMKYQEKAKESLQKLSDDKIATERQLQNVQMSLSVSSDECELWKEEYEKLKADWIELSNKHCELKNEMNIFQSKTQCVGSQESQCQQLHNLIKRLEKEQIELQALNDHLQEDNELQKEQLSSLQVRLRYSEEQKLEMQKQMNTLQSDLATLQQRNFSDFTRDTTTLQLGESPEEELQNDQLNALTEKLMSQEKECTGLEAELELITGEYQSCQRKLKQCREELKGISRRKPKRSCCFWMSGFMVILAAVMAFLFSNHIEHYLH